MRLGDPMSITAEYIQSLLGPAGASEPEVARICASIADMIAADQSDARLHLTFSLLKKQTQPQNDQALMAAVQFLVGAQADILEMCFEFVDENEQYYPLSTATVASAKRSGQLEHPDTGEVISDFASSILVYFQPTSRAIETLQKKAF